MRNRPLLISCCTSVITVVLVDVVASRNDYYVVVWWLDILVHGVAGMAIGFGVLWTMASYARYCQDSVWGTPTDRGSGTSRWVTFASVMMMTALVGLSWELYEVFQTHWIGAALSSGYISDTTGDLIADVVGAFAAWTIAHLWWVE